MEGGKEGRKEERKEGREEGRIASFMLWQNNTAVNF